MQKNAKYSGHFMCILNFMLGAENYFLLHFGRKSCEVIAIAADPYHKVAVKVGIFPRLFQQVLVGNVYLKFKAAALHKSLD